MADYQRIADQIRNLGAEIAEMRRHREEQETKRAEAAQAAEAAKKQEETLRAATSPTATETSSQMLSQQELMSMNSKQLQNYISKVQETHDSQRETQRREIEAISRASSEQTQKIEQRQYEAQMRQYKANLNSRRTIERLLLEQKNLP